MASAGAATAGGHSSFHGVFHETVAGAGLGYDMHGSAKMTIGPSSTVVKINVSGLDPTKAYGSHLHDGTCASGGGSHYKNTAGDSVPPNELWPTNSGMKLRSNRGGVAHATGSAGWAARTSGDGTHARSVVIHEPDDTNTKIACADLG